MCFATVIKKKKEDYWVVIQGIELERAFTEGDVVYQGPGGSEVVKQVLECLRVIHATPVVDSYSGFDPKRMLGYRSGVSLRRFTVEMTFWEREDNSAEGLINLSTRRNQNDQPILKMQLAETKGNRGGRGGLQAEGCLSEVSF